MEKRTKFYGFLFKKKKNKHQLQLKKKLFTYGSGT